MALRIATFNLKDFFPARGDAERPLVDKKVESVAASLRRARADVVALQEVGGGDMLDRLVGLLPELGYGAPVVGSADKRGIRNAILSRLPIQWSQVHQADAIPFPRLVEGDPDPFANRIPLRRGVVHVRIEAGNLGEVDVLTAHFKSNLPARMRSAAGAELPDASPHAAGESAVRSLVQRAAEALYVRQLVDGIFAQSPDHAICVLGDLNDTLESLPVRLVRGIDTGDPHHLRTAADLLEASLRYSCFHGSARTMIGRSLLAAAAAVMLAGAAAPDPDTLPDPSPMIGRRRVR